MGDNWCAVGRARSHKSEHASFRSEAFVVGPAGGGERVERERDTALKDKGAVLLNSTRSLK